MNTFPSCLLMLPTSLALAASSAVSKASCPKCGPADPEIPAAQQSSDEKQFLKYFVGLKLLYKGPESRRAGTSGRFSREQWHCVRPITLAINE
jgi:hypothetical protein